MDSKLATFVRLKNPKWVIVRAIAEQLLKNRSFESLCSHVAAARNIDELHVARCLSGLEEPRSGVKLLIERWCKDQIQVQSCEDLSEVHR